MGPIEAIKYAYWGEKIKSLAQKVKLGETMGGWKTWTGAAIIATAAALNYLQCPGCENLAKGLTEAGVALSIIGLGHKIEKAGK